MNNSIEVKIKKYIPTSEYYSVLYKDKNSWWPRWKELWHWMDYTWNPVLLKYSEAIEFASTLKTIDDINKFKQDEKNKANIYHQKKIERSNKACPVQELKIR